MAHHSILCPTAFFDTIKGVIDVYRAVIKRLSSRTSAHAGVAIPIKIAECCLKSKGIATPV